jgi:hypothetical protein
MTLLLCLCLALAGWTASAQGTFLYTWQGNHNLFQASFQIPASENQPGQYFEGGMFKSTSTVDAPDHVFTPSMFVSAEDASGFGPPLKLSVYLSDPASDLGVMVITSNGQSLIDEYRLSDKRDLNYEFGSWSSIAIPEPTALDLCGLILVALLLRTAPSEEKNYSPRRAAHPPGRQHEHLPV